MDEQQQAKAPREPIYSDETLLDMSGSIPSGDYQGMQYILYYKVVDVRNRYEWVIGQLLEQLEFAGVEVIDPNRMLRQREKIDSLAHRVTELESQVRYYRDEVQPPAQPISVIPQPYFDGIFGNMQMMRHYWKSMANSPLEGDELLLYAARNLTECDKVIEWLRDVQPKKEGV